ncbi:hypothetical protein GE21DRAFT_3082 [Neurospora crassa]|uniref:Uncharacterized protein n=2 Tax=Neurospora crassa TaxID=5141 RepID=F5H9P3_NEUCR|nr:hypothetical protein NCU06811 [Neurospora crassa OR74A]EAA34416.2 hypothetical protein NCU06811 [Neurospora crassa OR74A]KHE87619.1 hypothetical protein GE21DRAFT_3082 [Neurospora crassa]CAB91720.2 related to mucin (muc3) [Neurospora crassa]|eukprot:XP_963652.2 hypothetical protein NCU06811 [Neurospora crassa OR74A]
MWASVTPRDGVDLGVPQTCFQLCDDAFLESKSLLTRQDLCATDGPLIREFDSCNSCIKNGTTTDSAYAVAYQKYIDPYFGDILRQCIDLGATVTLSLGPPEPLATTVVGTIAPQQPTSTTGVEASNVHTLTAPFDPTATAGASPSSATGTSSSIAASWLTTDQAIQTNNYVLLTGETITVTELVIATITRADWTGWHTSDISTRSTIPAGGYGTRKTTPLSPTEASHSGSKSVAGWVWAVVAIAAAIVLGALVAFFVLIRRKKSKKARHLRSSSGSTPELHGTSGAGSRTELDSEINSAELHTDKIPPSELDSKVPPVEMDTEFRFELPTEYNKERDFVEETITPISTCTDATRIPASPLEEQKVLVTPGLDLRSKEELQSHTKPS